MFLLKKHKENKIKYIEKYGVRRPLWIETIFNKRKRRQRKSIIKNYLYMENKCNKTVREIELYKVKLEWYKKALARELEKKHVKKTLDSTIILKGLQGCVDSCVEKLDEEQNKLFLLVEEVKKYSWLNRKPVPDSEQFDLWYVTKKNRKKILSEEEMNREACNELYSLFQKNDLLAHSNLEDDYLEDDYLEDDYLEDDYLEDDYLEDDYLEDDYLEDDYLEDEQQKDIGLYLEKKEISIEDNSKKQEDKVSSEEIKLTNRKSTTKQNKENTSSYLDKSQSSQTNFKLIKDKYIFPEVIKNPTVYKEDFIDEHHSEENIQPEDMRRYFEARKKMDFEILKESCREDMHKVFYKYFEVREKLENKREILEDKKNSLREEYNNKSKSLRVKYQIDSYEEECRNAENIYNTPSLESFLLAVKEAIRERYENNYHISDYDDEKKRLDSSFRKEINLLKEQYRALRYSENKKIIKKVIQDSCQQLINKYGKNIFTLVWKELNGEQDEYTEDNRKILKKI